VSNRGHVGRGKVPVVGERGVGVGRRLVGRRRSWRREAGRGRRVGHQLPPWLVAGDSASRDEVRGEVVTFQRFLERAAEIHLWAPSWLWVRHSTCDYMPRRPAHGHQCDVASSTKGSVVVVAVEIKDAQTARGVFGSERINPGCHK
jgi:hypothetical protein